VPDHKCLRPGHEEFLNRVYRSAEIWSPDTQSFRVDAPTAVPRTYHSSAVLVPDGRVFVGGGGLCGVNCTVNHPDAEMYSPGYLFNANGTPADRPTISLGVGSAGIRPSFV
jgi:galactose oxidase